MVIIFSKNGGCSHYKHYFCYIKEKIRTLEKLVIHKIHEELNIMHLTNFKSVIIQSNPQPP